VGGDEGRIQERARMSEPIDLSLVKPNPVRTSTRGWAEECALAEAADTLDAPVAGVIAVANAQPPVQYEFSNGRRFRGKRNPYA
jgi:hypothetical protein